MFPIRLFPNSLDFFPLKQIKKDPAIAYSILATLAYVYRNDIIDFLTMHVRTIVVVSTVTLPLAFIAFKYSRSKSDAVNKIPPKPLHSPCALIRNLTKSTDENEAPARPLSEEDAFIKNLMVQEFAPNIEESKEDNELVKKNRVDLDYFYALDINNCKQKLQEILKNIKDPCLLTAVYNSIIGYRDLFTLDLEWVGDWVNLRGQSYENQYKEQLEALKVALKPMLEGPIASIKQEIKLIREQYKKDLEALRAKYQVPQAKL